jgi:VanZ family protein
MSHSTRDRLWRYGPLLAWIILIYYGSTQKFSALNTSNVLRPLLLWLFPDMDAHRVAIVHFVVRKGAHFLEYALLALLAARAFLTSSRHFLRRYWFASAFLLVAAYALLDEYHQSFVPSRTGSIYDSMIDATGGLAALVVIFLWRHRNEK